MQTAYPDYYPLFHCIADRCRHNCCIGWEIDVDGDSLAAYDQIGGEMGERLHKCIDRSGEMPHFLLGEQERCPFLNGKNLCDLILYGGEGMLCQICTDHPRYRSFLSERTEIGVGLCCEEAARLILTRPEKTTLVVTGEGELDEKETALLTLRDHLFAIAQNREEPINQRMEQILSACGAHVPDVPLAQWAEFYLSLERMDEVWLPPRVDGARRRGREQQGGVRRAVCPAAFLAWCAAPFAARRVHGGGSDRALPIVQRGSRVFRR